MTPKIVGKILEMVNRFEICRSFEEWPGLKRVSKGHFGYAAIGPISNVRLRGDAQGPELMAAKNATRLRRSLPISFRCRRGRCASKIGRCQAFRWMCWAAQPAGKRHAEIVILPHWHL